MADPTKILLPDEVQRVLTYLDRRAKRFYTQRANRMIFLLSIGCGLRRTEIARLQIRDLMLAGPRPVLTVRAETTKGHNGKRRGRKIALWWSARPLADLPEWVAMRQAEGAGSDDPLIISRTGRPLIGGEIARRWRTAIKCLGPDRVRQLPSHAGRKTHASLAFAAGRSLLEIRDQLGHADSRTSQIYLHAIDSPNARDILT